MRNTLTIICTTLALLMSMLAGCSPTKTDATGADDSSQEPVALSNVHKSEQTSFKLSTGEACQEIIDVTATYPKFFKDKASTEKLQKLFISTVLECNDSLSIDQAVQAYAHSITDVDPDSDDDGGAEASEAAGDDSGYATDNKFVITVNITIAYHQHDVITFCKEETVKKNEVTSKTHKYYNIDLKDLKVVDLTMFKDESLNEICVLLKKQLMEQNNVKSADALNDLGYFNIDNLTVTSNFFFDENGITWSYLPQELAANANIEPKITLDYGTLKQFAASGSVLGRF